MLCGEQCRDPGAPRDSTGMLLFMLNSSMAARCIGMMTVTANVGIIARGITCRWVMLYKVKKKDRCVIARYFYYFYVVKGADF